MTKEPVDKSPGILAANMMRGEARRSRAKAADNYSAALLLPLEDRDAIDGHMAKRHTENEVARRLEALAAVAEKGKL